MPKKGGSNYYDTTSRDRTWSYNCGYVSVEVVRKSWKRYVEREKGSEATLRYKSNEAVQKIIIE